MRHSVIFCLSLLPMGCAIPGFFGGPAVPTSPNPSPVVPVLTAEEICQRAFSSAFGFGFNPPSGYVGPNVGIQSETELDLEWTHSNGIESRIRIRARAAGPSFEFEHESVAGLTAARYPTIVRNEAFVFDSLEIGWMIVARNAFGTSIVEAFLQRNDVLYRMTLIGNIDEGTRDEAALTAAAASFCSF